MTEEQELVDVLTADTNGRINVPVDYRRKHGNTFHLYRTEDGLLYVPVQTDKQETEVTKQD